MIPAAPPQRPGTAFGLGLSGAIVVVIGSLFFVFLGFPLFGALAVVALAAGTVALAGSILMYLRPDQHIGWGIVVLVASAVSIVGLGGFVLGMILGVLGGALGIAWRPETMSAYAGMGPYGIPVMPWRMCMGCGRWVPWSYNVCPLCGHQAPVAPWAPRAEGTPPAVAPAARAPCPTCTGEAEWIPLYQKWHCPSERRYF